MTAVTPETTTDVARKTANVLYGFDSPNMTMMAEHMVVGAEGPVEIPLPAFLIEHDKGLIMVDRWLRRPRASPAASPRLEPPGSRTRVGPGRCPPGTGGRS